MDFAFDYGADDSRFDSWPASFWPPAASTQTMKKSERKCFKVHEKPDHNNVFKEQSTEEFILYGLWNCDSTKLLKHVCILTPSSYANVWKLSVKYSIFLRYFHVFIIFLYGLIHSSFFFFCYLGISSSVFHMRGAIVFHPLGFFNHCHCNDWFALLCLFHCKLYCFRWLQATCEIWATPYLHWISHHCCGGSDD